MAGGLSKAKSRQSSHNKAKYAVQKLRTFKNTQRKLLRHIEQNPNDGNAKVALANLK